MQIRVANEKDCNDMVLLYEELYKETAMLQPEYFKTGKQDGNIIKNIINDYDADIIVAEEDSRIIGFLAIQQLETPFYFCVVRHRYAYIMDIVVNEIYTGQGIGTKLIEEAGRWAEQRNLDYLELNVLPENPEAKKLYEKKGFKNVMETMRYKLK